MLDGSPAPLGMDGGLWTALGDFPAFSDASPASKAASDATLSPSLSCASSSADDDSRMDDLDTTASLDGDVFAQYFTGDATSDGCDSILSAEASIRSRPLETNAGGSSSAPPQSLLSTLWAQADAEKETQGPSGTAEAPPSPLLWANPTPALMTVDANQLPNADAMEIRRLKNRECMRRARQRQREEYNRMKATVERLEKQYAALCVRASSPVHESMSVGIKVEPVDNKLTSTKVEEQQYAAAVALCKRLGAENLHLKASLQQQAAWKQRLHRVLDSTSVAVEASSPAPSAPLRITNAAKPSWNSRDVERKLEELDSHEAAALFDFSPLDESAVGRAIIDNAHVTQEARASLVAALQANDPRVKRHDVLGWDVIQRVNGTLMEYTFTKTFKDLDVDAAGERMWLNDMQMDTFRVILYSLRRLDVLQKISPNAYVLGRDVTYPECDTVYRSLFMRFRTQVSREIPNGSLPPLKATGFVIGTHSLNRDWSCMSSSPRHASYHHGSDAGSRSRPGGLKEGESLEWLDMALVTEFLTIEDPTTGEKYHQIQWFGRTDPKSHEEAMRNAPDTLTVCLRTEMLTVGPAIRLLRSSA